MPPSLAPLSSSFVSQRQRGCLENEFMNLVVRVWVMDPNARASFEVPYWCDGSFFVRAAVGFKHVSATGIGLFSFEPIIFLFRAIQECAVGKTDLFVQMQ